MAAYVFKTISGEFLWLESFNSLLTWEFLHKLTLVAGNFYFGLPKINPDISQTLCGLLYPITIPDTTVKSSTFCEMFPSIHSSVETKEHSLALWVSFPLSVPEPITEVFLSFDGLIFTMSESELHSEELSSSDTPTYTLLGQSEQVSA